MITSPIIEAFFNDNDLVFFKGESLVYKFNIQIHDYSFEIKVSFQPCIKLLLPKFYIIDGQQYFKEFPVHINRDRSVCLLSDDSRLHPDRVLVGLNDCLYKLKEIINLNIKGENSSIFNSEIKPYWIINEDVVKMGVLFLNHEGINELLFAVNIFQYIIICNQKTMDDTIFWISNRFHKELTRDDFNQCYSIPFKQFNPNMFPVTLENIFSYINDRKSFEKYMSNTKYEKTLVFYSEYDDGLFLGMRFHFFPNREIDGFRQQKVPVKIQLFKGGQKTNNVTHFEIDLINNRRLFYRGGTSQNRNDEKIKVFGVGSIGGILTETLVENNYSRLHIYDNQSINLENISRHICGMSDLFKPKVEAVKNNLIKRFPYINIDTSTKNIYDIIKDDLDELSTSKINFFVTGDTNINYFIISKRKYDRSNTDVFMWVEPYLLSGHILIINKKVNFSSLYDENNVFINNYVINPSHHIKSEAGCQTDFVQYSMNESKRFIYDTFMDVIKLAENESKNYHVQWYGDLSKALSGFYGKIEVNGRMICAKSYSTTIKEIK